MEAASEETLSFLDNLKKTFETFDFQQLLPSLGNVLSDVAALCKLALFVGPVLLLALGLIYYFLAPKEANWYIGYRCYFGMGSPRAWQYTQKLAGLVFIGLGGVLLIAAVVVSLGFSSRTVPEAVSAAAWCLAAQVLLTALGIAFINLWTMNCFDAKGHVRKRTR